MFGWKEFNEVHNIGPRLAVRSVIAVCFVVSVFQLSICAVFRATDRKNIHNTHFLTAHLQHWLTTLPFVQNVSGMFVRQCYETIVWSSQNAAPNIFETKMIISHKACAMCYCGNLFRNFHWTFSQMLGRLFQDFLEFNSTKNCLLLYDGCQWQATVVTGYGRLIITGRQSLTSKVVVLRQWWW
jgi:hypothetical protein